MNEILTLLAQYGIAGITIYIIYELFKWHTKEVIIPLRDTIRELVNAIHELRNAVMNLHEMVIKVNAVVNEIKDELKYIRESD